MTGAFFDWWCVLIIFSWSLPTGLARFNHSSPCSLSFFSLSPLPLALRSPIFYMRKKAAKDLDKAVARLERFAIAPEHVQW